MTVNMYSRFDVRCDVFHILRDLGGHFKRTNNRPRNAPLQYPRPTGAQAGALGVCFAQLDATFRIVSKILILSVGVLIDAKDGTFRSYLLRSWDI